MTPAEAVVSEHWDKAIKVYAAMSPNLCGISGMTSVFAVAMLVDSWLDCRPDGMSRERGLQMLTEAVQLVHRAEHGYDPDRRSS